MNLEISVEYAAWSCVDVEAIASECINSVFSRLELNHYNIEICLLFTDDEEMRLLNKTYRGVDGATNVLAFPANSIDAAHDSCNDDVCEYANDDQACCNVCILGSIVFAYEFIARESEEQGKSLKDHLRHLVIHGVLHLLGYDHVSKAQAKRMESLEIEILAALRVANPYC
jgi:probable rRNA maturation factor